MQMGNGNGDGNDPRNIMHEALEAKKLEAFATSLGKFAGVITGFLFTLLVVPLLIVYAYNGLQPEVWANISYLPTVAGLFVFRILIHMIRKE